MEGSYPIPVLLDNRPELPTEFLGQLSIPIEGMETEASEPEVVSGETRCRKIKPLSSVVEGVEKEIEKFRRGDKKPIITGEPYLDNEFPVINGSVILIGAPTGVGKSFTLAKIQRNVMDRKLNPDAGKYVFMNYSLEMKLLSLLLRSASSKLKVTKKDILFNPDLTPEKLFELKEYFERAKSDERQYICDEPITVRDFVYETTTFLEEHADKETVFIAFDHLALVITEGNMNATIEKLISEMNILKLKFPNVVFILLSQVNDKLSERAKDNDIKSQPVEQDIYYSKSSAQIADYIIIIVNPKRLGINEYSKIYKDRYPHLANLFISEDNKGRASLQTIGVNYYHMVKCREAESGDYVDIYAEEFNFKGRDELREKAKTKAVSRSKIELKEEKAPAKFIESKKDINKLFKPEEEVFGKKEVLPSPSLKEAF